MDKKPLESKKWTAFFFAVLVIAILLGFALWTQTFGWPMVAFMCIGVLGITYLANGLILTQGANDKFIEGVKAIVGLSSDDKPDLE